MKKALGLKRQPISETGRAATGAQSALIHLHLPEVKGIASARPALLAEADGLAARFAERVSDGSFCERRGLYEHHERMVRQSNVRLAQAETAAREGRDSAISTREASGPPGLRRTARWSVTHSPDASAGAIRKPGQGENI